MKNLMFLSAFAMLVLFFSCQKESFSVINNAPQGVYASDRDSTTVCDTLHHHHHQFDSLHVHHDSLHVHHNDSLHVHSDSLHIHHDSTHVDTSGHTGGPHGGGPHGGGGHHGHGH